MPGEIFCSKIFRSASWSATTVISSEVLIKSFQSACLSTWVRKTIRTLWKIVDRCLKDDGIFLLHTIGGNTSEINCEPWITKYIFPNGMLPSIAQIGKAAEDIFVMEDWHNFGPLDYLNIWHDNFQKNWGLLHWKSMIDRFKRMWEYYLLSCAWEFPCTQNTSMAACFYQVRHKTARLPKKHDPHSSRMHKLTICRNCSSGIGDMSR